MIDTNRVLSMKTLSYTTNYARALRMKEFLEEDPRKHSTSYIAILRPWNRWNMWRIVRIRMMSPRQVERLRERQEAYARRHGNAAWMRRQEEHEARREDRLYQLWRVAPHRH